MTNIATIIGQRHGGRARGFLPLLFVALLWAGGSASYAQVSQTESTGKTALDTIPEEAKAVFYRYVQQKDTAMMEFVDKHRRDKFVKRFSFHTNAVDWVTLVPNLGVEFDLNGTPRNNYSISIFGKFNGRSTHGKLVYNVNAVRVEGRKYWRTGKHGKAKKYYDDFERLYTDTASIYFNADTLVGRSYYVDTLGRAAKAKGVTGIESIRATSDMTQAQKDSLDFAEDSLGIKESKFRKWYYNTYHKFRRNVTSGRTLENARNWRAYYLGVWAGMDNWSISITGKGKQGQGVGAGLVAGYTLPLLPQRFPREGSLDLDFGLAVGWKAVKYDAYNYEEQTQHYVYDQAGSHPSWKIVPYPIVQDIHVSLVWRFRGIKSKVDKSLIDDYNKKWVEKYNDRATAAWNKNNAVRQKREEILEAMRERTFAMADSTGLYDGYHRRRLDAAMRINPDTVFVGEDQRLYLKIFKGLKSVEEQDRYRKSQQEASEREAKEATEQARKAARESARMAKRAARELADSIEAARKDSIREAKKHHVQGDTVQALSADTTLALPIDTVLVSPEDSVPLSVPRTDIPAEDGGPETEERDADGEDGNSNATAVLCAVWRKWRDVAAGGLFYYDDRL